MKTQGSSDISWISRLWWVFPALLVFIACFVGLGLRHVDLSVPLHYQGDTLWFLVPIKGLLENGWPHHVAQLSAPFQLDAVAFPSNTHTDWLLMKGLALIWSDAGSILNAFWILTLVLSSLTCAAALRVLGVGRTLAAAVGVLYAFLPFALIRNTAHISLVYYLVPLIALLAIYIANGCRMPHGKKAVALGFAGLLLQGFNYIYFSFFAVLIIGFAAAFGCFRRPEEYRRIICVTLAALVLIVGTTGLNLLPSYLTWKENGQPPDMSYKSAQEAEVYGLKLRKLVAPHQDNAIPGLAQWGQSDRSTPFPNENENVTARLGLFGTAGFALLLLVSLGFRQAAIDGETGLLVPVAALGLFSFLVATVGGISALISQVAPDIRAYNRFSVFLSFFYMAGAALFIQRMGCLSRTAWSRALLVVATAFLIGVSFYDQLLDGRALRDRRPTDEASARAERDFVKLIEGRLPREAMVFQLPVTGFPPDGGIERMLPYDHGRPMLWSQHLRWSWPSFSLKHRAWLNAVSASEGQAYWDALTLSGFRAVWIDRFGYADGGLNIATALQTAGATLLAEDERGRYAVFDLAPVEQQLRASLGAEYATKRKILLNPVSVQWLGTYPEEFHGQFKRPFRWSPASSAMVLSGYTPDVQAFEVRLFVAAGSSGTLKVTTDGSESSFEIDSVGRVIDFRVGADASGRTRIDFVGLMGRMALPPGESRDLHFYIIEQSLTPIFNDR